MRHNPKEKVHRNYLIREYWKKQPSLSLEQIGKVFGISKQRVWEIIKKWEARMD